MLTVCKHPEGGGVPVGSQEGLGWVHRRRVGCSLHLGEGRYKPIEGPVEVVHMSAGTAEMCTGVAATGSRIQQSVIGRCSPVMGSTTISNRGPGRKVMGQEE